MELYLLRYFLSVVETGSFTRAADQCLISQPSLSAGIKRLETDLGVSLFVRNNKRVFLTDAGSRFLTRAKTILHECNMATVELAQMQTSAVIRLGVLQTIPSDIVAGFIEAFGLHAPGASFELIEGTEQELLNRQDERGIDYALSLRRGSGGKCVALFEEGYSLAIPRAHALAGESVIAGETLKTARMIVRTRCEVLSETSRHFTDLNVRPSLVYRTQNDERALAMVGAGVGITVMPDSYYNDKVARIPMKGFDFRRTVAMFTPQYALPAALAKSGRDFTDFAESYFRSRFG